MTIKNDIYHVLDTETTGFDETVDKLVEFAYVKLKNGKIIDSFETLINPERDIPPEASAIHHLIDEDVKDAPFIGDIISDLRDNEEKIYNIVAHNAEFDYKFLKEYFPGANVICTYRLAMKLWPDLPKHTNQYLRYYFKLPCEEVKGLPAHRAKADAIVTSYLFMYELDELFKRSKDPESITVAKLIEFIEKPSLLKVCKFGKHKDKLWSEVPLDYLRWMLREMKDLDRDTEFTVRHYLGI